MRRVMRSSGDLIADRRYQYASELAREGDAAAAQGAQAVAEATLAGARTTHDNDFKRPLVEKTLASLYRQQEARA